MLFTTCRRLRCFSPRLPPRISGSGEHLAFEGHCVAIDAKRQIVEHRVVRQQNQLVPQFANQILARLARVALILLILRPRGQWHHTHNSQEPRMVRFHIVIVPLVKMHRFPNHRACNNAS